MNSLPLVAVSHFALSFRRMSVSSSPKNFQRFVFVCTFSLLGDSLDSCLAGVCVCVLFVQSSGQTVAQAAVQIFDNYFKAGSDHEVTLLSFSSRQSSRLFMYTCSAHTFVYVPFFFSCCVARDWRHRCPEGPQADSRWLAQRAKGR